MTLRVRVMMVTALACAALASSARAQTEADVAMKFFLEGGAYCARVAPEGTNLSEETEWTILVMTGATNRKNDFKIRTLDPGVSGTKGSRLTEVGLQVTGVWRRDRVRDEFFERFAAGISGKTLRARVVRMAPPGLATMTPPQRAESYLKFADRGTRIDFSKVADLGADEFSSFRTYVPD